MAALITSRKIPRRKSAQLGASAKDKEREGLPGLTDGPWVAQPDLVPSRTRGVRAGPERAHNQLERRREGTYGDRSELRTSPRRRAGSTSAGMHRRQRRIPVQSRSGLPKKNGSRVRLRSTRCREDAATAESPAPDLAVGPAGAETSGRNRGHTTSSCAGCWTRKTGKDQRQVGAET